MKDSDPKQKHHARAIETPEARLTRKVEALQVALEASEAERLRMLDSNSWRLTAPVRWIRRCLERDHGSAQTPDAVRTSAARGLASLPATLKVAPGDRPDGPNDTFHPLDLDAALSPLLPMDVVGGGLLVEQSQNSRTPTPTCAIKVAFIGGVELRQELSFDAQVTSLLYDGWEGQLAQRRHDLLLIETAWEPDGGWRYGLLGQGPEAAALRSVLETCHVSRLPIVVWFREEDANVPKYAWIAAQADRIYAVDEQLASRLSQEFPTKRIDILRPAIQPALHNPVRSYRLRDALPALRRKVLIDGWWDLAGSTGRSATLDALRADILVAESEWDVSRVRIGDLPELQANMIGCLTWLEKAALSRIVPLELFLGESVLPRWRRDQMMLRAAACGTVVVQKSSEQTSGGMSRLLLESPEDGLSELIGSLLREPLTCARRQHLAFREIVSKHCVADRLQQIATDLELQPLVSEGPARVAVLLVTMRPERLLKCLEWFRSERYAARELIVVLHGDVNLKEACRLLLPGEPVRILQMGRARSLGDCLNFAAAQTDAPYWVKMDDDDHYGPDYLSDLMLYRRVSNAPLFGKPPMFLHMEDGDDLLWDPVWAQHANLLHASAEATSALVAGGTLGGRREILEEVRFSGTRRGGSDSEFIRRCYEHNHDLLATDGFNFARFRSGNHDFHTWKVSAAELTERALPVGRRADLESQVFL